MEDPDVLVVTAETITTDDAGARTGNPKRPAAANITPKTTNIIMSTPAALAADSFEIRRPFLLSVFFRCNYFAHVLSVEIIFTQLGNLG